MYSDAVPFTQLEGSGLSPVGPDAIAAFLARAGLTTMPEGYMLLMQRRSDGQSDKYLVGHYSGKRFRSAKEFAPHAAFLLAGGLPAGAVCECRYCDSTTSKRRASMTSDSVHSAKKLKKSNPADVTPASKFFPPSGGLSVSSGKVSVLDATPSKPLPSATPSKPASPKKLITSTPTQHKIPILDTIAPSAQTPVSSGEVSVRNPSIPSDPVSASKTTATKPVTPSIPSSAASTKAAVPDPATSAPLQSALPKVAVPEVQQNDEDKELLDLLDSVVADDAKNEKFGNSKTLQNVEPQSSLVSVPPAAATESNSVNAKKPDVQNGSELAAGQLSKSNAANLSKAIPSVPVKFAAASQLPDSQVFRTITENPLQKAKAKSAETLTKPKALQTNPLVKPTSSDGLASIGSKPDKIAAASPIPSGTLKDGEQVHLTTPNTSTEKSIPGESGLKVLKPTWKPITFTAPSQIPAAPRHEPEQVFVSTSKLPSNAAKVAKHKYSSSTGKTSTKQRSNTLPSNGANSTSNQSGNSIPLKNATKIYSGLPTPPIFRKNEIVYVEAMITALDRSVNQIRFPAPSTTSTPSQNTTITCDISKLHTDCVFWPAIVESIHAATPQPMLWTTPILIDTVRPTQQSSIVTPETQPVASSSIHVGSAACFPDALETVTTITNSKGAILSETHHRRPSYVVRMLCIPNGLVSLPEVYLTPYKLVRVPKFVCLDKLTVAHVDARFRKAAGLSTDRNDSHGDGGVFDHGVGLFFKAILTARDIASGVARYDDPLGASTESGTSGNGGAASAGSDPTGSDAHHGKSGGENGASSAGAVEAFCGGEIVMPQDLVIVKIPNGYQGVMKVTQVGTMHRGAGGGFVIEGLKCQKRKDWKPATGRENSDWVKGGKERFIFGGRVKGVNGKHVLGRVYPHFPLVTMNEEGVLVSVGGADS
ncbi:hypothetical protein HDU78_003263 [Chytriomyces hyalinus]|nr:hypothetical protein HDU78_003263 [Chytriomyces hyalinus]